MKLDPYILKSLSSYDGKRVAPFCSIADEISIRPDALEIAILIIDSNEPNANVGGSWILKHLLELGFQADKDLCKKVLSWLESFDENDARLHLLQILNHIEIPKSVHHDLFALGLELASDKNTFIRAWAYNLIGLIAYRNFKFEAETQKRLQYALNSETASIKARIRNMEFFKKNRNLNAVE